MRSWRTSLPRGPRFSEAGSHGVQVPRQVLEPAVNRHRHHGVPGADLPGDLQCPGDVESGARPPEDAFASSELPRDPPPLGFADPACLAHEGAVELDRKSTRLNSSHLVISYAVFCLKKKK